MTSKETEYIVDAGTPTPNSQDLETTETTEATVEEVCTALQYDAKAQKIDYDEALKYLEDGRDYVLSEATFLHKKAGSWKDRTKESWSLKITDSIEYGSDHRSWISRGIALASDKRSLTMDLNTRLYYFCGMHLDPKDNLKARTLKMMKCLLAQLLVNLRVMRNSDDNIGWTRLQIEQGAADDLPTILQAFEHVFSLYPDNALLHIIIDHLHLYWGTDLEGRSCILSAMEMFEKLIKDKDKKVFLKLVLTSSEQGAFFGNGSNCRFQVDYVSRFDSESFPEWSDDSS